MAAFFAIICTGCTKEEQVEKTDYTVEFNVVKNSFGNNTKAARTNWEKGDVVTVVFKGDEKVLKYLELTYDNDRWSTKWQGTTAEEVIAKTTKEFYAVYLSQGVKSHQMNYLTQHSVETMAPVGKGELVMSCNDGTYTVIDNKILLTGTMTTNHVQVTIKGLEIEDGWDLTCNYICYEVGGTLYDAGFKTSRGSYNMPLCGHENPDGVAFFGAPDSDVSTVPSDFLFTLQKDNEIYYTRTIKNKTIKAGQAIIINGPTAENLNGWSTNAPAFLNFGPEDNWN